MGGKYNIDENRWYWTNHNQIPQNNHHWEGKDENNHDHPYCMAMDRTMWDHRRCSDPHIHLCKSVVVSPNAGLSPQQPTLNCAYENFLKEISAKIRLFFIISEKIEKKNQMK